MQNNNLVKIFDLDGTTVNSRHRTQHAFINGRFCVPTYLEKCNTPELIKQDSLLPLAEYMRSLALSGETFVIMTARGCTRPDISYLINNELVNSNTILLSRDSVPPKIQALGDAQYKLHQFERLKSMIGYDQKFMMFEDMPDIIQALGEDPNMIMIDAVALNHELKDLKPRQITPHVQGQESLLRHWSNDFLTA